MGKFFYLEVIEITDEMLEENKHFNCERRWASHADWSSLDAETRQLVLDEVAKIDGICIVKVNDFILTTSASSGMASPCILFNAKRVAATAPYDVFAYVPNSGRGALTDYWCCTNIIYSPGSIYKWGYRDYDSY